VIYKKISVGHIPYRHRGTEMPQNEIRQSPRLGVNVKSISRSVGNFSVFGDELDNADMLIGNAFYILSIFSFVQK
jgi:hypothetical protein